MEIALPPGGWYDLNSRAALRGTAGASLQGRPRSVSRCSAGRAMRCRSGLAVQHTGRDPRGEADRAAMGVRQADGLLEAMQARSDRRRRRTGGSRRATVSRCISSATRCPVGDAVNARTGRAIRTSRSRAASPRASAPSCARCSRASCGQAIRGASRRPRRSRSARCARETHRRRTRGMCDYDPAAHAPSARRIEVWDRPLAVRPVPGRPDPTNAPTILDMLRDARRCLRDRRAAMRSSRRRCRRARSRTPAFRSPGTPNSSRTAWRHPRVVMMLVGGTAEAPLRVALVTTHSSSPTCRKRSRRRGRKRRS